MTSILSNSQITKLKQEISVLEDKLRNEDSSFILSKSQKRDAIAIIFGLSNGLLRKDLIDGIKNLFHVNNINYDNLDQVNYEKWMEKIVACRTALSLSNEVI